jgi:hypothetical protein
VWPTVFHCAKLSSVMAEAVRVYAKAAGLGRDIQNHAAEVKVEAEVRAGELLKAIDKHPGGRPGKTATTKVAVLSDLDIADNQSSRWQREATVPAAERKAYYRDAADRIVDGRHHYEACRLAGVKPTFKHLPPRACYALC